MIGCKFILRYFPMTDNDMLLFGAGEKYIEGPVLTGPRPYSFPFIAHSSRYKGSRAYINIPGKVS